MIDPVNDPYARLLNQVRLIANATDEDCDSDGASRLFRSFARAGLATVEGEPISWTETPQTVTTDSVVEGEPFNMEE